MFNLVIPSKSAALILLDSIAFALDNADEVGMTEGDREDLKNIRTDIRSELRKEVTS